ncbi:hypothetical protein KJ766_01050 [Patescibacteria group bacterium]|nr:hypothetical protein [Patescibacteria group bacterium]
MRRQFFKIILICIAIFAFPSIAFAGNIDSTDKWAWGEKIGWINFGVASGNVNVTSSTVTGYAWSTNYGWINMQPSLSGVVNDGSGNLSGYAWGENLGWINFSGVSIDTTGEFHGYATSAITGDISFNCLNASSCASSDYKVKTSWNGSTISNSNSDYVSNAGIEINDGSADTQDAIVLVSLESSNARYYILSEDPSFLYDEWQPFVPDLNAPIKIGSNGRPIQTMSLLWNLSEEHGTKTIYAKFRSSSGNVTTVVYNVIDFNLEIVIEDEDDASGDGTIIKDGDYVRTTESSTVYLLFGDKRRPVIDEQTFFTYEDSWDNIKWVDAGYLSQFVVGRPILPKPNTVLVKIQSVDKVYMVVDDGTGEAGIRWIESELIAEEMYGAYWQEYVIDVNPAYFYLFTEMSSVKQPEYVVRLEMKSRMFLNSRRVDFGR